MEIKKIIVKGIVQGVGFRPFVYRLAKENNLKGYVKNMGNYVEIIVAGNKSNINNFLKEMKHKKPALSQINEIIVSDNLDKDFNFDYDDFNIKDSDNKELDKDSGDIGTIPPDVAICEDCLKEMLDKSNRRYKYPFIACTNCGPRFTIVKKLPYDRDNTSMDKFPLCEDCLREYRDPMDRRFHAQATCCPRCGPRVYLVDREGNTLCNSNGAINEAIKILSEGNILAIKGIGGSHLACHCDNDDAIIKLRKRLNRPTQPFAIMTKEENLRLFADPQWDELILLKSPKRPIVVVEKNENYKDYISEYVSNLNTVGVMLPYSGMHYLLLEGNNIAYVMTSANLPGYPMVINNRDILFKLKNIADYFLLHDRKIVNRCDDSVLKKINNNMVFIRRSRGYAPEPIIVNNHPLIKNNDKNILCVGPEINSTVCLIKGNKFYLSQYIGNTSKYETFNFLKEGIENLIRITNSNRIDAIVCDLHPSYNSTNLAKDLAERFGADLYPIQHHKAHGFSLLGDNDIFQNSIIITIDGVGYGEDGNIWGGEILRYSNNKMDRIGHLEEQYMPGGDLSTKYPLRILLSILYKKLSREELIEFINGYNFFDEKTLNLILFQLDKKINVSRTTSCGRVLDSISSMLNICNTKTYDGEPAIRLESISENFKKYHDYREYNKCLEMAQDNVKIKNNILNTTDLVYSAYNMLLEGYSREFIALYVHLGIAEGLSSLALRFGRKEDFEYIGLTGGVSYNKIISERIRENIEKEGFKFLYPNKAPNGDGGISFGQGIGYILNKE
ncbi:MAG TPA: carbamoyltransferase HypF [Methanothermococcus okinawensis]|uniref:Carbamoyltransferase n=1 Tax=Methanothermococcus okinawensis TaxID=155863 RepID=A0A832YT22_9EURY|nr:carbamoyltransferase HypF [Methanothermococcus okinawensis]